MPDASTAPLAHRPRAFPVGRRRGGRAHPRPDPPDDPALPPTSRSPARWSPRSTPAAGRRAKRAGRRAGSPGAAPRGLPPAHRAGGRAPAPDGDGGHRGGGPGRHGRAPSRWAAERRGRRVPGPGGRPRAHPPRGAAARPPGQREPRRPTAEGAGGRLAPARGGPDRRDRVTGGLPGGADAHRTGRRDPGGAAAGPGPRAPDVARRPAALREGALGRAAG